MEYTWKMGPFLIEVYLREIRIMRDRSMLIIKPYNMEKASELLLNAMRIESFPVKPDRLDNSPYTIRFHENGTMTMFSEEGPGVRFSFDEGDTVAAVLEAARSKWVDVTKADRVRVPDLSGAGGQDSPPFDRGF